MSNHALEQYQPVKCYLSVCTQCQTMHETRPTCEVLLEGLQVVPHSVLGCLGHDLCAGPADSWQSAAGKHQYVILGPTQVKAALLISAL